MTRAAVTRAAVTLGTRAAALSFAMLLLPRLAVACPTCASQQPGGVARIVALGVMIVFPFSVVFAVFRALRRASPLGGKGDPTRELRP